MRLSAGVVLVACLGVSPAFAQGYGVYEQSACNMGRGGAGVASPCDDGSAIYFNPAAIARDRKIVFTTGATLVQPRGGFTNTATSVETKLNNITVPVPAFYAAVPLGERVTFGAGLFVPYGLETRWKETFEGRYLGYRSVIQAPYVQPTIAVKLADGFYVGGGIDLVYTNLELQQRADLSTVAVAPGVTFANLGVPRGTDFADISLRGTDWGTGYHVGVMFEPSKTFSFGARYMSQVEIADDAGELVTKQINTGRVLPIALGPTLPAGTPIDLMVAPQFATGGRLANQAASAGLTHPDQFVAGIAIKPNDKVKVLVDYQFTNWADFDVINVVAVNGLTIALQEDYKNTHGLRVGTDIAMSDNFTLRAGLDVHTAGAPDTSVTPNLPEGARAEYSAGFGYRLGSHFRLDAAYMYLDQEERGGRTVPHGQPNNGTYAFYAHLFGASLVFHF